MFTKLKTYIRKWNSKGLISGKVINFYGHPIKQAKVLALVNGKEIANTFSDNDGNFTITGISLPTRKILIKAVKGKRDGLHTDLTHRGSYGTGRDVNNLIKVTRFNPSVTNVQVPLIDVPGPKVPEFNLIVKPIVNKFMVDNSGAYFAKVNISDYLRLNFFVTLEPKIGLKFAKYAFSIDLITEKDGKVVPPKVLDEVDARIEVNNKLYHWSNIHVVPFKPSQILSVHLKNLKKIINEPFKLYLNCSIFLQEDKRKYIKFSSGYFIVD